MIPVQISKNNKLSPGIILLGPTGIGKTEISLKIAEKFSCEIISVDSMQVYRYMDIGTAKATPEERRRVTHYLIDIVDPDEDYNVARFVEDASLAGQKIRKHGNIPFFVGGTGLYFKGLLEGLFEVIGIDESIRGDLRQALSSGNRHDLYEELKACDPVSASRIHPNDSHRLLRALEIFRATGVPWSQYLKKQQQSPLLENVLKLGLTCDREKLYKKINKRVERMIDQGLLDEVKKLLAMGYDGNLKSMQSIGYRHMVNYLEGRWSWQEAKELLARDTRRFAKRQYTWFSRDPEILWFEPAQQEKIFAAISTYLLSCLPAEQEATKQ